MRRVISVLSLAVLCLLCTACGRVFDAPMSYHPEYDERVSSETGFQIKRHRTVFEGLCPECFEKEQNLQK